MAKVYYQTLIELVDRLQLETLTSAPLVVKHFFGGAALYIDGVICASLSPAGLAFRLADSEVSKLINSGQAKPLKYFPKGYVKKGYALFEAPELADVKNWASYFEKSLVEVEKSTL